MDENPEISPLRINALQRITTRPIMKFPVVLFRDKRESLATRVVIFPPSAFIIN